MVSTGPCVQPQTKNILKYLFPVPKEDSKRVMTFANTKDFISFRSVFASATCQLTGPFLSNVATEPAFAAGITSTKRPGPSRWS